MDAKAKFDSDLKKGKAGESVLYKKITKYSPNGDWVSYNDFDTDIRSKTQGVIEVKTETSTSYKLAFNYKGQWLPRYQWFCVNYAEPTRNKAYKNSKPELRRGPWKTARDAKLWANEVGNPKLKGLYVKQWMHQTLDHIGFKRPYKLDHLLVIFDPETLAAVLERQIGKTFKMFAHNFEVYYNSKKARPVQIPEKHGVKKFFHGMLCPDVGVNFPKARAGTQMCRVFMDMSVVFKLMEERGKPVTFDLKEGLRWLKN